MWPTLSPSGHTAIIKSLERIQQGAKKYIPHLQFQSKVQYKNGLVETRLNPLSYWREYLDMALFYKAINGLISIDKTLPTTKVLANPRDPPAE